MSLFNAIIWSGLLLLQITLATAEDFPDVMTLVIEDDYQTIVLNWKRTEGFLANENLPIWIAQRNKEPELNKNLMQDIGPFTLYHDVEKSSAVVLFHYQQRIYGIIDTRFIVTALPLSQVGPNIRHAVGSRHVKKREDKDFHDDSSDFPFMTDDDMAYVNSLVHEKQPLNHNNYFGKHEQANQPDEPSPPAGLPNEQQASRELHQVDDTLYAEILIFISNNVVKHFTEKDPDLKLLVAYYIMYFNAIDMLFAKLYNDIRIHINIAGLVLESEFMVFPYVFMRNNKQHSRILDGEKTLDEFPKYIKQYNNIFPRDSFDFFHLSTHYQIMDEGQLHYGLSITVNNYANRKDNKAEYEACGVLVERKTIYSDFVTSAHEIAHQLHVEHDPENLGKSCRGDQCFAIMQVSDSYCRNCIRWSDQSINELKAFASSNLDHCFLLNRPRSLHPHGTILRTLGPDQQCRCYKYTSHWTGVGLGDVLNPRGCNVMLLCTYQDRLMPYPIPKPIDGTPCGLNEVCWQGQCQPLGIPSTGHL